MIFGKKPVDEARKILGPELFAQIKEETGLKAGLGNDFDNELRVMSIADKEGQPGQELQLKSFAYYSKLR